jgi:hypothetical protein
LGIDPKQSCGSTRPFYFSPGDRESLFYVLDHRLVQREERLFEIAWFVGFWEGIRPDGRAGKPECTGDFQPFSCSQDDSSLDYGGELADISGPGVLHQELDVLGRRG